MENIIIYLAKASVLLGLFFLAYTLFLKKETFFNSNRWYLIMGLITSALLPLFVYTKTIWVDPVPIDHYGFANVQRIAMLQQSQLTANPSFTVNWYDILTGIYAAGIIFLLIRFLLDFHALRKLISKQAVKRDGRFLLVDSPSIKSPFSFFNYIVFNSVELQSEELESIICHEKVHSRQYHSLDMIAGQLFCITFWFNPFIWMYKKCITQNLEFIADSGASKLIADKQVYQKTLLKITLQPECIAITNHFYQSLIKKRIVMLNKKQSNRVSSWKYGIIVPVLVAFTLAFQVKTVAQEKPSSNPKNFIAREKSKISIEVTKDSKNEELLSEKQLIKDEFGADVNFENIKRNQKEEITAIKVTVTDEGQSQHYEVSGTAPIRPFTIEVEKDSAGGNSVSFGTGIEKGVITANSFFIEGGDQDSTGVKQTRRIMRLGRLDAETVPSPPGIMQNFEKNDNKLQIKGEDVLVVIDGVKKGKGEAAMKGLNANTIASISVDKSKEARKKYGREAKNGVIEITTRKPGERLMRMPQSYRMEIPEMMEHFNFNFDMPEIPEMQNFRFELGNMEDFDGIFKDGELIMSENLTPEEREKIKIEMQQAREEIRKKLGSLDYNKIWEGTRENLRENQADTREDIKRERMEMEKVRKELQEAKKELELARKNLNKKA